MKWCEKLKDQYLIQDTKTGIKYKARFIGVDSYLVVYICDDPEAPKFRDFHRQLYYYIHNCIAPFTNLILVLPDPDWIMEEGG